MTLPAHVHAVRSRGREYFYYQASRNTKQQGARFPLPGLPFGPDGRLYVTGHDRAEVYVLTIPKAGTALQLASTIALPFEGQAFAFDRSAPGVLYGIARAGSEVVVAQLPPGSS